VSQVHLCEAVDIASCGECDMRHYGSLPRSTLVAVKILRQDASEAAKNDFHKEVRIMSRLKDANIVHVLGVCLHDEPLAVIIEYMPHGDLNEFLLRHQLEDGLDEGLPLLR
jgi:serine/threonine protein kinase